MSEQEKYEKQREKVASMLYSVNYYGLRFVEGELWSLARSESYGRKATPAPQKGKIIELFPGGVTP